MKFRFQYQQMQSESIKTDFIFVIKLSDGDDFSKLNFKILVEKDP